MDATFPVAILAGGLATRLRPLTQTFPKALLDVAGEPFIAHQLRLLRRQGVARVVICAGYLGEMIREFVHHGEEFGVDVTFAFDGPKLLGTAGALRQARPLLGQQFFVLYGDSYLPCDLRAVQRAFTASGQPALMTVYRNDGQWDASNVEFADGKLLAYDKRRKSPRMRHIDYGLGVLSAAVLDEVPADSPYDLAVLYQNLLRRGQLAAAEVPERFYEIGSFQGLDELAGLLRTDLLGGESCAVH